MTSVTMQVDRLGMEINRKLAKAFGLDGPGFEQLHRFELTVDAHEFPAIVCYMHGHKLDAEPVADVVKEFTLEPISKPRPDEVRIEVPAGVSADSVLKAVNKVTRELEAASKTPNKIREKEGIAKISGGAKPDERLRDVGGKALKAAMEAATKPTRR